MWKQVPNFETYEASEEGLVRNKKTGKILKNSIHKDGTGIPNISLVKNNKTTVFETRFIIACTFLNIDMNARPKPKLEYIDGDKTNNSVNNIKIKTNNSINGEQWKPIPDWEEEYEISNFGRVKRLARTETYIRSDTGQEVERHYADLIMKLYKSKSTGYMEVGLRSGERSAYPNVHRLVAQAFIPNPDNKPQVNHKDGNKENNCVENLEWVTESENIIHSVETGLRPSAKGTDRSAKAIKCTETGQVFTNKKEAAKALDLPYYHLTECINANKPCRGYHFEQIALDRRVKCLDTGEIFDNLAIAQEKFGFQIDDSIKRRTCIRGWTFCYMRDLPEDEEAYLWECRNRYSKWPRAEKRWEENK